MLQLSKTIYKEASELFYEKLPLVATLDDIFALHGLEQKIVQKSHSSRRPTPMTGIDLIALWGRMSMDFTSTQRDTPKPFPPPMIEVFSPWPVSKAGEILMFTSLVQSFIETPVFNRFQNIHLDARIQIQPLGPAPGVISTMSFALNASGDPQSGVHLVRIERWTSEHDKELAGLFKRIVRQLFGSPLISKLRITISLQTNFHFDAKANGIKDYKPSAKRHIRRAMQAGAVTWLLESRHFRCFEILNNVRHCEIAFARPHVTDGADPGNVPVRLMRKVPRYSLENSTQVGREVDIES